MTDSDAGAGDRGHQAAGAGATCSSRPALAAASPPVPQSPLPKTWPEEFGGCLSWCPQRPGFVSVLGSARTPHRPGAGLASPAQPERQGRAWGRGEGETGGPSVPHPRPGSRCQHLGQCRARERERKQEQEAPSPRPTRRAGRSRRSRRGRRSPAGGLGPGLHEEGVWGGPLPETHAPSPQFSGKEPCSPEGYPVAGQRGSGAPPPRDPALRSRGRPPWRPAARALPTFGRMSEGGAWPRPPGHEHQRSSV